MEAKVSQITLVVRNQEEALKFYTQKVGFQKKTDFTPSGGDRWVAVGPRGQDLEFALFQAARGDANNWSKDWKPGIYPPVVIRVDDCLRAAEELKARGVRFVQEPKEYQWGVSATFCDPDGNLFSINQLPSKSSRS